MAYKAIHIYLDPLTPEFSEILIALLDAYEFEGIHERENVIDTYIAVSNFNPDWIDVIQSAMLKTGCRIMWEEELVPDKNWNALWESNFDPVIIDGQCVIRAPFHPEFKNIRYLITIEPKMAFGTGHHQTTRLMMEQMLKMEMYNTKVLDMGCGTGVLGILASLMGASEVISVDTDNWAYQSTLENAEKNQIKNLTALEGDIRDVSSTDFNIILANINRNTLLKQMYDYARLTKRGGRLLLSGILEEDFQVIEHEAVKSGFKLIESHVLDGWIVMLFERN